MMRLPGSRGAIAVSLSLALGVATAAAAQDPPTGTLVLVDSAGDLADPATGEPLDGPAVMDLVGLEVMADGSQLAVRFQVAEMVVEAPDPVTTTVDLVLNIDTDGDGFQDFHVQVDSVDGWQATLFDYDTVFETELGPAIVVDDTLGAVILLSELGFPSTMRFQAFMSGLDFPDPVGDPTTFTEWEDRVPDGLEEWRAIGESDAVPSDDAMVDSSTTATATPPPM
jgi:hypothetical protein